MYLDDTNTWRMPCGCTEANVLDNNHNVCKDRKTMNREEIVEELAEGIFQYSSSIEEIVKNTENFLATLAEDVQVAVHDKVLSRSIDKEEVNKNFEELGWC